jgi:penicillin-binding protein 1A
MAKRQKGRAKPDGRASDGDLAFGLGDDDRATGGESRRARRAAPRGRSRKKRRRSRVTLFGSARRVVKVLASATVLGVLGMAGIVGFYAAKLPPTSEWTVPQRPATVKILADNGALITTRGEQSGEALTLDEMPPYLPEAVIAIEDRRFYSHFGVDPIGLVRAAFTNLNAGGVVQGGSTLTQQLAKNLFLKPERTFERKVQEVVLALWLEARLSKRRILELYLNRVYLGSGAYGVDAAALRYFGKSARNVTLAEAATLAGLLKAPGRYSPANDPDAAEGRAQVVLTAMRREGYVTDRDASLAMSVAISPVHDIAGGSGRYVADWVMDILPGYVGAVDEDIVVDTTIDLGLQAAAARSVAAALDAEGAKLRVSQGALVAMDPYGAVKALVGGRDYAKSPFNRAVDAHRQPGSAFKPFVYLAALEAGYRPDSVMVDQPVSIKGWKPKNYTKEYLGAVTLETALALSLNTVSAQLTAAVGPSRVAATARRLGITSPMMATPSLALGTSEVTLLELTGAFAPFANGGEGVIPHVVKRIATIDGKVLYQREGSGPGRVVDPRYVGMMNAMLRRTLESGTGKRAAVAGWPAAGKTGTSQEFRDAWFVGYTGTLVTGVWFGNDNNKPTKKSSGSNLPAVTWQHFMTAALEGTPVADLPGTWLPGRPDYASNEFDAGYDQGYSSPGPVRSTATPEDYGASAESYPQPPRARGGEWEVAGPVPPGEIGGGQRRGKGLLERLFGG